MKTIKELQKENRALCKLLEWAEECGFGLDNIGKWEYDIDNYYEETEDMDYIDSLIWYAERWIEKYERE